MKTILLILSVTVLSGCATASYQWVTQEGVKKESKQQVDREFAECSARFGFSRRAEADCLYSKGYELKEVGRRSMFR